MARGVRDPDAAVPPAQDATTAWCSAPAGRDGPGGAAGRARGGGGEGLPDRALPRPPRLPGPPRPGRPRWRRRTPRGRPPCWRTRSRPSPSAPTSPSSGWPALYAAAGEPSRFVALCERIIRRRPARLAGAAGPGPPPARGGPADGGATACCCARWRRTRRCCCCTSRSGARCGALGARGDAVERYVRTAESAVLLSRSRTSARPAATARTTCSGAARTATSGTPSSRSASASPPPRTAADREARAARSGRGRARVRALRGGGAPLAGRGARLATRNPDQTSVMRQRAEEARRAGRPTARTAVVGAALRDVPAPRPRRARVRGPEVLRPRGRGLGRDREGDRRGPPSRRFARGGSTITQQLAKNLFFTTHRSLVRKLRELIVARWLEEELGKKRILELYLNVIEWGDGIYGSRPPRSATTASPRPRWTRWRRRGSRP